MERIYLVRFGLMHHVGRFAAGSDAFRRGQAVVVRSYRGLELGEVLTPLDPAMSPGATAPSGRVLRPAAAADFDRARAAARDRPRRLEACGRALGAGHWPLVLLDVEPLLDDRRTVVYYLGPHRFDAAGLVRACREAGDLDAVFEPAGRDGPTSAAPDDGPGGCCGVCGPGGCGPGHASGGGCSGCAVEELVRSRRAETA